MCRIKFNINEVILIIMGLIKELEFTEVYGESQIEELYFPKPIEEKLSKLTKYEYEDFMNNSTNIAEEVYELKTGELNELNFLHQEIKILAEEILIKYLC
ncbi:hypothetical protein ACQPU1_08355 [Clostridium paraputrificum]|uniref:hypothetical protein n=1 Tax=Clostridium TaxID=1485 RepID=UPI003D34A983